jgi:hypothetical protein
MPRKRLKKRKRMVRRKRKRKRRKKRKPLLLLKLEKIQLRLNLLEVHQELQLDTTSINSLLQEVNHMLKNKAKELMKLQSTVSNINQ